MLTAYHAPEDHGKRAVTWAVLRVSRVCCGSGEAGPRQPRDMTSPHAFDIAPAPSAALQHQLMFWDRLSH